jgi:hypothetical protein
MKTQRQLMVEGVYETALLCAFRGVQCTVQCTPTHLWHCF